MNISEKTAMHMVSYIRNASEGLKNGAALLNNWAQIDNAEANAKTASIAANCNKAEELARKLASFPLSSDRQLIVGRDMEKDAAARFLDSDRNLDFFGAILDAIAEDRKSQKTAGYQEPGNGYSLPNGSGPQEEDAMVELARSHGVLR